MRGILASNAACTEAMTSVLQIASYVVVEKGLEHKREPTNTLVKALEMLLTVGKKA